MVLPIRKKSKGFFNKRGITLVTSIILIVFVSIAVFGVTIFIVERLLQNHTKRMFVRAIDQASAGIHAAIYQFRARNGFFTLGRMTIISDNYYVLGAEMADLLMVNNVGGSLKEPDNNRLKGLFLHNATNSANITIKEMILDWNNSERLIGIGIEKCGIVRFEPPLGPREVADIDPDCTIKRKATQDIIAIRFTGNMTAATISAKFIMADDSVRDVLIYDAGTPLNDFNFNVKSTGKTTGEDIYRTIEVEYNAETEKVVALFEIDEEITP